jgi:hypothetical protein
MASVPDSESIQNVGNSFHTDTNMITQEDLTFYRMGVGDLNPCTMVLPAGV